ncbi:hypothetical protein L195_g045975, partial [Trifolium pratense]
VVAASAICAPRCRGNALDNIYEHGNTAFCTPSAGSSAPGANGGAWTLVRGANF